MNPQQLDAVRESIPFERVQDLITALGVGPLKHVKSVHLTHDAVTVQVYPLDAAGQRFTRDYKEGPAVDTLVFPVSFSAVEEAILPTPVKSPEPHSRACGITLHGSACSSDCPTCHGVAR